MTQGRTPSELLRILAGSKPGVAQAGYVTVSAAELESIATEVESLERSLETAVLDAAISDRLDDAGAPLTWKEVAAAAMTAPHEGSAVLRWKAARDIQEARAERAEAALAELRREVAELMGPFAEAAAHLGDLPGQLHIWARPRGYSSEHTTIPVINFRAAASLVERIKREKANG